jgi:outer membrane protein TolC
MRYGIPLLVGLLFILPAGKAQKADSIQNVLDRIGSNNKTLRALRERNASKLHELRSQNRPPDPRVSAYYLPWNEQSDVDYSEFELSQSFAFPTVYALEKERIALKEKQREQEYRKVRQKILLQAEELCFALIHVRKRLELVEERKKEAQKLFEHVKARYDSGGTSVLAYNKAKLARTERSFRFRELEEREDRLLLELESLNGGKQLQVDLGKEPASLDLPPLDTLWQERRAEDPELLALMKAEEAARKRRTLTKHRSLPRPTIGMNTQGVPGNRFTGVYGGISIPLWGRQEKKKMAEAKLEFRTRERKAVMTEKERRFRKHYWRYRLLKEKYNGYKKTLQGADSRKLLLQAYESGEIPYKEYYRELRFYQRAKDRLLEMEKKLHQVRARLLKHRL